MFLAVFLLNIHYSASGSLTSSISPLLALRFSCSVFVVPQMLLTLQSSLVKPNKALVTTTRGKKVADYRLGDPASLS